MNLAHHIGSTAVSYTYKNNVNQILLLKEYGVNKIIKLYFTQVALPKVPTYI